jgi:predicted protein tyrosine phosphatase
MPKVRNVLFVCSRNRLRSPTAEQVFGNVSGIETASAGTSPDAEEQITPDHIDWADIIFVMERSHRRQLATRLRTHLKGKRIVCLDIPDKFAFMDPALVELLKAKVAPHLR